MAPIPYVSGHTSTDLYRSIRLALTQKDLSYDRIRELRAQFLEEWKPNLDWQYLVSMEIIDAYAAALVERESARAEDLEYSTCPQDHLECRIREDGATKQAAYLYAILKSRAAEGDL